MWFSSPPVGALRTQNARDSTTHLPIWPGQSQDDRWASSGKSSMRARAAAPIKPASGPSAAATTRTWSGAGQRRGRLGGGRSSGRGRHRRAGHVRLETSVVGAVGRALGPVHVEDDVAELGGRPAETSIRAAAADDAAPHARAQREHEHLAGAGAGEMLMLTLGTGVGGGIICGGRPYRGFSGAAAELGHIILDVNGPKCPANCSNHGCLEAYVAGPAMAAAAAAAAAAQPASALGRALAAGEQVDGRLLTRLGLEGDAGAVAVLTRLGEYLGAGLVTLVNIFNPEVIVIGGAAAAAGELLLGPARGVLQARGSRPARDQVRVVPAALGPDAGLIGAAGTTRTWS